MATAATKEYVTTKDEWPIETFANIMMDVDEPELSPEEIQAQALSQMTARILTGDNVVGPSSSKGTQAPSRAPSPSTSRRSSSSSIGSSVAVC